MVRARVGAFAVAIVALIGLAGVSVNRVYNGQLLAGLVAGAALGAVTVSVLLRRSPAVLVAPASVLGMLAYGTAAIAVSARAAGVSGGLSSLLLDAGRNAVPRLLTALIPVEAQPDTVLGPVVLAWLAGFAAAELTVRAGRPAAALTPPIVLYVLSLVFVGPNLHTSLWQPVAFVAIAAIGLASYRIGPAATGLAGTKLAGTGPARTRLSAPGRTGDRAEVGASASTPSRRERRALEARGMSMTVATLAVLVAVVAVAAPFVVGAIDREPIDPRRYVQPPSLEVLDENPLIRISGWAADPAQKLFTVNVLDGGRARPVTTVAPAATHEPATEEGETAADTAAYDTRLRLAVLADWDGVTWHSEADYRGAGRVLPDQRQPPGYLVDPEAAPSLTIRERIVVDGLQGRLLPAISAPHRVDGVRVAYDQGTGTILRPERLAPGVAYTVTSVSPSINVNVLPAADVPSGPVAARFLAVGDTVPADLSRLAEQIQQGQGSPYLKALALEAFIAEHYRVAGDAPSGHAYPNLRFFLFDSPRAGGGRGTSEQFATAFATLGRLMGLPTRVVVGFRTPAGGGVVTAADALAWPEVLFSEVGWVAFDPMPKPDTPPRPLEDEYLPKPTPPTSPPASIEPSDDPTWTPAPSAAAASRRKDSGLSTVVVAGGAGGAAILLVLLVCGAILLLRARLRRARLEKGSPAQRVIGAWAEIVDALALAGTPPAAHLSAAEIAQHAAAVSDGDAVADGGADTAGRRGPRHARPRHQVGPPRTAATRLADLAMAVNTVRFAGPTLASFGGPEEAAARDARRLAVEYADALRSRLSWWRRLVWRLSLRPLRRRSP